MKLLLILVAAALVMVACFVPERMRDEELRGHYVTVMMNDGQVFKCKAVGYGHSRTFFSCEEIKQ